MKRFCALIAPPVLLLLAALVVSGCKLADSEDTVTVTFTVTGADEHFVGNSLTKMTSDVAVRTVIIPPKVYHDNADPANYTWELKGWSPDGADVPTGFPLENGSSSDLTLYAIWEHIPVDTDNPITSDWLILSYMDADNNLEGALKRDFNEMELGLYHNDNSTSIKVVVLYDGRNNGDTAIYELGPDNDLTTFGKATIKIPKAASFLAETGVGDLAEANMSDYRTLQQFLEWATLRYKADKTVLQFSDHGAGPRNVRAMLQDETSGSTVMNSGEVATGLLNAGYTVDNRVGLILLDVCLGASLEDAVEFGVYSDYVLASTRQIPAEGMNYRRLFEGITAATTLESFGADAVQTYKAIYGDGSAQALTCYRSDGIFPLAEATNALADVILSDPAYGSGLKSYLNESANRSVDSGGYIPLVDLGFLAEKTRDYSSDASDQPWAELHAAAQNVMDAASAVMVYSWKDKTGLTYYGDGLPYGIAIGSDSCPAWYAADLQFGKGSWGTLLSAWF
jgi:hypothetical protein